MAYATVDEMATLLPDGIDESEEARAEALLDEFSVLAAEIAGWTADPDPIPRAIKSVVIQAAMRVFDNPGDLQLESLGQYSWQRPRANLTGLSFTKKEESRIRRAVGKSTAGTLHTSLAAERIVDINDDYVNILT